MMTQSNANLEEQQLAGDILDPLSPDLVGGLLDNAGRRNLRKVSKRSNEAFFDNLKCADAQELQSELQAMPDCQDTVARQTRPSFGQAH